MKINWFSPLPPARTDIAHYTARIIPVLSQVSDLTLWTYQQEWDKGLEHYAPVLSFKEDKLDWSKLNRADATLYNIGNDGIYHRDIFSFSQQHSGIILLHDFNLHELFEGIYRSQSDYKYLEMLRRIYGSKGLEEGIKYINGETSKDAMITMFPFYELALNNSLGAVIHNFDNLEYASDNNPAPVFYTPLPYANENNLRPLNSRISSTEKRSRLSLICFGYFGGKNRRLIPILKSLASYPKKDKLNLNIYGEIQFLDEIVSLIESLKLKKSVTFHGFAPENKLNAALDSADLAINLRYPTRGEASGSLLRTWNHALPSLVTKAGWFKQLPESCVAFVRPDAEEEDIHRHLNACLADPGHYRTMGLAGRKYLEENHSSETFVRNIMEFIPQVISYKSKAFALELGKRTAGKIADDFSDDYFQKYLLKRTAKEIFSWTQG